MSGTAASNSWDEIWAEFDARQPLRGIVARAAPARAMALARPARGVRRLLTLIAVLSLGLYLASPVASALQFASAIQRGDAQALAGQVDWAALRPALTAALAHAARESEPRPMPAFVAGMARDMAVRLAEPEALARLLNEQLAQGGPAREMLGRVRIHGPRSWDIALASPHAPGRPMRITLALADPLRLRWEVRAIELPSRATLRSPAR